MSSDHVRQIAELEDKLRKIDGEYTEAIGLIAKKNAEIERLEAKIDEVQIDRSELHLKCERLETKNADLEVNNEHQLHQRAVLQNENERLQEKLATVEGSDSVSRIVKLEHLLQVVLRNLEFHRQQGLGYNATTELMESIKALLCEDDQALTADAEKGESE